MSAAFEGVCHGNESKFSQINDKKKAPSLAIARAATMIVEHLESRQLLSSVITTFPVPGTNASQWNGSTAHIIPGPDGNFWFTDPTDNAIGKVTPAGVVTLFPLPVHNAPLNDGSGGVGPDDPAPQDIVVGPNGNLWFTANGSNQFGRITTGGVVSEFALPSTGADAGNATISINDLSQASDGTLWLIDANNPQVVTINLSGALLAGGGNVSITAGSLATSTFASFTDFSGASSASDYSATITLDDGSTLPASIAANSAGGFDVTASNDWTIGYDNATVTVTDTRDATRVATATTSINANAPTGGAAVPGSASAVSTTDASNPVLAEKVKPISFKVKSFAGQTFNGDVAAYSGVVSGTTKLADLSGTIRTATVYWGDGTHSAGTLAVSKTGQLTVTASHAYRQSGKYTVWVSVTQKAAPGASVKVPKVLAYIKTTAVVSAAQG